MVINKGVGISFHPDALKKLDTFCKGAHMNRSEGINFIIGNMEPVVMTWILSQVSEMATGKKPSPETMKEALAVVLQVAQ